MSHKFGWCQAAPGTRPDAHHDLCEREYVSQVGVKVRCGCPAHEWPEEGDD